VKNQLFTTYRKRIFAGVLVVAFATITSANPYAGVNDDPTARLSFAMDPFENPISHSYSLGDAKEKILRRFGVPSETSVSTYDTRWVGETQTSYRLAFADVEFVVISFDDQPTTWIESIEITGNAHDLKFGIRIGTPRAEIVSRFAPAEHLVANNPMHVSIPTLEKRARNAESKGENEEYTPTFDITFEFDDEDRLSRLSIFTVADD
jgi:hypothetical protein